MKNRKSLLLLCACVVILFLGLYFPNKIMEIKHTLDLLIKTTAETQAKEDFYRSNFELNSTMTGLTAPDVLCTEYRKDSIFLSVMAKESPLLIFRIIEKGCTSCNVEQLSTLQQILPENIDYAIVLYSNQKSRDLLFFKKSHKYLPIYLIPFDAFGWIAEESQKPYYFVLNPDMKISHIYVPNKDYPELNEQYLEGVKRFLSE